MRWALTSVLLFVSKAAFAQPTEVSHSDSAFMSGLQMFAALGAVILLAYLVLHKGLGFLVKRQRSGDHIKVKERLALDPKNALFIIEVSGQSLLIAAGENGVQMVSPLDAQALPRSNTTGA